MIAWIHHRPPLACNEKKIRVADYPHVSAVIWGDLATVTDEM